MNFFLLPFFRIVLLLFLPGFLLAQSTITGIVSDQETKEPLIGVNILIVGTSSGTITDFDGSYTLKNVPSEASQIEFRYTGYDSVVLTIGAQTEINVEMTAGQVLDEVVVIGYGEVNREDFTGSIQVANSEDFNRGAITSAQDLLAGKIAGVNIVSSNDAGGGAQVRIRGGSSLNANNEPLYVIDGLPIDTKSAGGTRNILNIVNPNDIESFTVLKDASATAIYGSRASNGVILITTKRAQSGGKFQVGYNGNISISNAVDFIDVLDASEYRALIQERHPDQEDLLGDANTNWQEEIFKTGVGTDHALNFSGGIKGLPYRFSIGFTDKKGILKTDEFTRYTGAINLNPKFLDNTLQVNFSTKANLINNRFADKGSIGNAAAFDPTQSVTDDNDYGGYFAWLNNQGNPNTIATTNPLALLEQKQDVSDVFRVILNGGADYRFPFLPQLRANIQLGYDHSDSDGTVDIPENAAFAFDAQNGGGEDKEYSETRKNSLFDFFLNYTEDIFGNNQIDVTGGYSYQRFEFEKTNETWNVARTQVKQPFNLDSGELYLLSLFGRVNFKIGDKLLLTGTARGDASSRFSKENRWGFFPAAAAAYKFVENPNGKFNAFKIRAGWGITGQQEIGENQYYSYLANFTASQSTAQYAFGEQFYTTLRPEAYDENIKWEETTTYNVGLDYGLLNNRLYGTLDYYFRETEDLLVNDVPIPIGSNFSNRLTTNIGTLTNQGVELAINAIPLKAKNYVWDLGLNLAYNQNEITKLSLIEGVEGASNLAGDIAGGVGNQVQINQVGAPSRSFYVQQQVYNEDGSPIEGEYVDLNGDLDPDNDLYLYEQPDPNLTLGLTTAFSLNEWTLSLAGRARFGAFVYNNVQSNLGFYNRLYNSSGYLSNVSVNVNETKFAEPQYFSDYYVQNSDFFRLDHITLSYTFEEVKIPNDLQLYVTVQNPFVITDYVGIDPEVTDGIDRDIYPRSRTFLFGVNATF